MDRYVGVELGEAVEGIASSRLSSLGWERIQAIPLLPVPNAAGLYYGERTWVQNRGRRQQWAMRSFDLDFCIASRKWRRLATRWFSVGVAIHLGRWINGVFLGQAWDLTEDQVLQTVDVLSGSVGCGSKLHITAEPGFHRFAMLVSDK